MESVVAVVAFVLFASSYLCTKLSIMSNPKCQNWLKYHAIIRTFIQKKYGISIRQLESIVFLWDEGIFRVKDAINFFKATAISRITLKLLIKNGYIDNAGDKKYYTLTPKADQIVREYYEYVNMNREMDESEIEVVDTPSHRLYSFVKDLSYNR